MTDFFRNNKTEIVLSIVVLLIPGILFFLVFRKASFSPKPSSQNPTPDIQESFQEEYSRDWITKLPLKDPSYYVDYDSTKNVIKARISPLYSRSGPKEEQVKILKDLVTQELQSIGADLSKEKIEWVIDY